MVARVTVEEAVGPLASTYLVGQLNLVSNDVPALLSGDELKLPILPSLGGGPGYSFERWFRMRFTGFFTSVRDLYFEMPSLTITGQWGIKYGVTSTYRRPINNRSPIAVHDPPVSPVSIGAGPYTGDVHSPAHSLWIVLQALVTRDTSGSLELPIRFTYSED